MAPGGNEAKSDLPEAVLTMLSVARGKVYKTPELKCVRTQELGLQVPDHLRRKSTIEHLSRPSEHVTNEKPILKDEGTPCSWSLTARHVATSCRRI